MPLWSLLFGAASAPALDPTPAPAPSTAPPTASAPSAASSTAPAPTSAPVQSPAPGPNPAPAPAPAPGPAPQPAPPEVIKVESDTETPPKPKKAKTKKVQDNGKKENNGTGKRKMNEHSRNRVVLHQLNIANKKAKRNQDPDNNNSHQAEQKAISGSSAQNPRAMTPSPAPPLGQAAQKAGLGVGSTAHSLPSAALVLDFVRESFPSTLVHAGIIAHIVCFILGLFPLLGQLPSWQELVAAVSDYQDRDSIVFFVYGRVQSALGAVSSLPTTSGMMPQTPRSSGISSAKPAQISKSDLDDLCASIQQEVAIFNRTGRELPEVLWSPYRCAMCSDPPFHRQMDIVAHYKHRHRINISTGIARTLNPFCCVKCPKKYGSFQGLHEHYMGTNRIEGCRDT